MKADRRSAADRAFRAHGAAVRFDEVPNDGQPQARASLLASAA
jgi:hypothetical protein